MDPEIIKVQADISDINAKLDEVDQKFEKVEDSAKGMGQATEQSSKKAARGLDEVTSSLKKAEAEQKRLTNLIREQEKITGEFRQELIRLTRAYNDAGKSGTVSGLRIKKQMDQLNSSIKDQTVSVQQLKREQAGQAKVVKDLKDQEKQLKKTGKEIDKTTKKTSKLESGFKKLGSQIAAAFAIQRLISFGVEAVKMADRAAGIETAFQRVGASVIELRRATQGTISDVELMTAAVNAKNLGVPVEELAGLLGFASSRARETGQTVDGLVQSIVNGLGRKSTLVLDNLGISAVAIKKALGDTSLEAASVAELTAALNKVIAEQGGIAETTASGVQTLGAAWDNYMVAVGKSIDASETVGGFGKELQDIADVTERSGFWAGLISIAAGNYGKLGKEARVIKEELEGVEAAHQGIINEFDNVIAALRKDLGFAETGIVQALKEQLEQIEKQIETAPSQEKLNELLRQRLNIQNQITKVTTLAATGLIGILKEQLSLVTSQIDAAGSQDRVNELLEKKLKLETEMNAILSQRKNIESFEADGEEPEELEFDQSFFEGFNRKADAAAEANAKIEQSTDDLFDAELEAQQEAIQKKQENDEAYAAWKAEQDQLQADAYIGAMGNMFEAFRILAADNAEAQKAIAIFQAVINAYLAIQNTLATIPGPPGIVAAAAVGILAFANVAKIASTEPPKFYDGTDYVALNGNRPGKDTVHAMLNEGEGVVTTKRNRQFSGVVKSLNDGSFDKHYIKAAHVQAGLKALKKEQDQEKTALLTAAIKGTVNANLNDSRIVGELRRSRRVSEEMAYLLALQSNRKNPYRI